MVMAVLLAIVAAGITALAVMFGGGAWVLLWPATDFAALSIAYIANAPQLLGKRCSGALAKWAIVIFLPYFLLTWLLWHAQRLFSREPRCDEVVSGLWIGRRLVRREIPLTVGVIVDLTAEFPEPRRVRETGTYWSLPVLDASVPDMRMFRELVESIAASPAVVLIHCASGHGRSGLFAAAVLLARGLVATPDEAIKKVRAARPGVRLNREQKRFLNCFYEARKEPAIR